MIVEAVREKCRRKTSEVMKAALAGEDIFPWTVPVSKGFLSKDLAAWKREVEQLRRIDKTLNGSGPQIVYVTKNTRLFGTQSFPQKIIFETCDDFLDFTSSRQEWLYVSEIGLKLRQTLLGLEGWLGRPSAYRKILEHQGKWEDLIEVCKFFRQRKTFDRIYLREIPLKTSTKFIEENISILREMLDVLLEPNQINETSDDFFERFSVEKDHPRVRIRISDPATQIQLFGSTALSDIEMPVHELNTLLEIKHSVSVSVFVIENLTTFLTFPKLPSSVTIYGGGYSVLSLKTEAFNKYPLFYWGDLDVQGFEILSAFRSIYKHAQSIFMDTNTLEVHRDFLLSGVPSQYLDIPSLLNEAEVEVYSKLKASNLRLEQERIPSRYALETLLNVTVGS